MNAEEIHQIILESGLDKHGLQVIVIAVDPQTKNLAWASTIPRANASTLVADVLRDVIKAISN